MRTAPSDHDVPLLAALVMLVAKQPDRALTFLKRHQKRWVPGRRTELLTALALAQQGHVGRAGTILETAGLDTLDRAYGAMPQCPGMMDWLGDRLTEIARKRGRLPKPKPDVTTHAKPKPRATATPAASPLPPVPDLPRLEADFTTTIEFANADAIRVTGDSPEPDWFRLRGELRPARPVPRVRRIALPAGAARRGDALVPGRNRAQGAEAVSRSRAAGRRGRPRQDHRSRHGGEGIHAARHGRARADPDTRLAGRPMARGDG